MLLAVLRVILSPECAEFELRCASATCQWGPELGLRLRDIRLGKTSVFTFFPVLLKCSDQFPISVDTGAMIPSLLAIALFAGCGFLGLYNVHLLVE